MWLIIVLVRNVPANMILCNSLSASPTKWSNTLKQFVGKMPANCLSMFDHFVWLTLKGLKEPFKSQEENASWQPNMLNMFTMNNKDCCDRSLHSSFTGFFIADFQCFN